ncbi:hypothetical protein F4556_003627 [Kitasatospora gansuensis]|uniref:Uncharacterized protein n=1 Tax=Kitasatospora gansuensis TaxID=258050 RepID=A0A7W7SD57_9ACTN|nr:hypothetical protein [Kitasatospora gansuensis]MBB4948092.1 hypothetical protein [Kitasatospora gansuensis]
MKLIVAGHWAVSAREFAELAFGVDADVDPFGSLFGGVPGESAAEWAARTAVAREVLAELMADDPESAAVAAELMRSAPVPLVRRVAGRRPVWSGVAA